MSPWKCKSLDYQFKDFNVLEWPNYKAWIIVKNHAKWSSNTNEQSTDSFGEPVSASQNMISKSPFMDMCDKEGDVVLEKFIRNK